MEGIWGLLKINNKYNGCTSSFLFPFELTLVIILYFVIHGVGGGGGGGGGGCGVLPNF